MNNPLLLLIGVGAALGLNFPIGKLAMAAGVWIGAGVIAAGILLSTLNQFRRQ